MKNTQDDAATEGCAPAAGYVGAEKHPKFPSNADPFTQSAWRIGWEQGHGLRKAPKGIKYGLENTYRLGLRIAAKDRHTRRAIAPALAGCDQRMVPLTIFANRKYFEICVAIIKRRGNLESSKELKPNHNMNTIDRNALVSETRNEYVQTNEGLRRISAILDESQSARCPHTTEKDRTMTLNDESLTVGELMDCRSDLFTEEAGE